MSLLLFESLVYRTPSLFILHSSMAGFQQSDRMIVRDYITAKDHEQYSLLPEDTVAILMTHSNLPAKHMDLRFDLHTTILDLKERFRLHIGTPVMHQKLQLKRNEQIVCELSDDSKMLGFYGVESGNEIHIIDTDPFSLSRGGGLTDTTLIEKVRMTEDTYEKRGGTVRQYIREQKLKNPNYKAPPATQKPNFLGMSGANAAAPAAEAPGAESVEGMAVGMRCEVMPGSRRGTVRFVGELPKLKPGHWVCKTFVHIVCISYV